MSQATIVSRFSLKWARNSNSIGARSVALGAWTTVRVGMLWSVPQAVSASITPDFAFGLSSGTSAVYGDASATHFVGVSAAASAWTRNGNQFFISGVIRPTKQVGVTKTNGTNLTSTNVVDADAVAATAHRSVFFVEITKGSPNYSFKLFHRSADAPFLDNAVSDLITTMESASPTLTSHTFTAAQTLAVDEGADGTLDAAQFFWNLTTATAEIDAIMVTRTA